MTTLVLAPHPDDEAIGCGGSLCLHSAAGERVVVAFLTSGELGLPEVPEEQARRLREREAEQAAPLLGVARLMFLRQPDWMLGDHVDEAVSQLHELLADEYVSRVYLPHEGDAHPDHAAAAAIGREWAEGREPDLLSYEVWTPLPAWDVVNDIGGVVERKLDAVAAYASQDFYDYARAVRGLAQYRGALAARTDWAEVFRQEEP